MSTSLFSKTPTVTVLDNRGLTVRDIAYHRHPDTPDITSERITRHQYDARGFLTQSADPRLHDAGLANFSYLTDLTGNVLLSQGVDNGTTVALNDGAGRPFITVSNISTAGDGTEDRSQAVTRTWQYENATLPGRQLSITEQVTGEAARITERFVWGGNSAEEKALNLAGACVSHYDTAGLTQTGSVALTGVPLSVTRHLIRDADNPDVVADWLGTDASAWNDLLAGESERYITLTTADATGAVLTTTDAKGNLQRVSYDVAGLLSGSWLTLKGGKEQAIVASLTYSAAGQKLRDVHGNGVVTTYTYEAETQRLTGVKTERPAGHASGTKVLQDLRYEYDPVGNILKISNDAEEPRFWRNQKVVPENAYVYDSLYQLVSATGREMANAGQQGCSSRTATVPLPTDSSAFTNYTRSYTYDEGGNLTQIRHSAPATGNSYTTDITVSDKSNRGVLSTLTENPSDVDALFTACGQQSQLQPGQGLVWTPRSELLKVTPVVRDGGTDDRESYRYDAGSQRILKVSGQKTGNSTQTQRALYLPGLELRMTKAGDTLTESLQVITAGEEGRAQVRVLHWVSGQPAGISNHRVRYSYDNLTGSSQLELDDDGNIVTMEEYYPYGGTSVWTARSMVEADYKTIRYSGKERDATGLYYYGYRYYQPWASRWLSSDPAGTLDGLNLFRMVRNNPVTLIDKDGRLPTDNSSVPDEIRLLTQALNSRGKDVFQRTLIKKLKYEESNAPPVRSGWEPKDWKERLNNGKALFYRMKNTKQKRYFIGRMGNEREILLNDSGRKIGVLNSNVWSLGLNDAFIHGGINIGATFYLWNNPSPSELKILDKKKRSGEISMHDLIREMPPEVNFPLLMRVPASENEKAEPSVTAREIELLLDNHYRLVNEEESSPKKYHYRGDARNHYQYRFIPSMKKRQALSVEKHIRNIRTMRGLC